MRPFASACFLALWVVTLPAQAQRVPRPSGNVSMMGDWFPDRSDTAEIRARLFAEQKIVPSEQVTFTLSGFAEGLLARRPVDFRLATEEDFAARVHEATASVRLGGLDLYAGYGRIVWGRLDELQPTDVINPLDISRFFFEGRSEARLPVALVRARWYFTDAVSLEGVYVPFFRRGRFDQLEEATSPFNIVPPFTAPDVIPVERLEPSRRAANAQGGARFSATTGTVDWSLSAYRGLEPFGLYQLQFRPPIPPFTNPQPFVEERFPRFTMAGGDFETVTGQWGIRGEVAAFVHDNFQVDDGEIVEGRSVDAGLGVDRKAGNYRVSGTVLFHHERSTERVAQSGGVPGGSLPAPRSTMSLILSADRAFVQERYQLRAFSVYNPSEQSSFLRAIFTAKLRDDLAFEASSGWFAGDGRDTIGRFSDSDFVYARIKYYF